MLELKSIKMNENVDGIQFRDDPYLRIWMYKEGELIFYLCQKVQTDDWFGFYKKEGFTNSPDFSHSMLLLVRDFFEV